MRRRITKPTFAARDNLVVIECRLRKLQSYARLSLWSAIEGDELSPHVPYGKISILIENRPSFVQPTYVRLVSEGLRKYVWQFHAEEDLSFCVMQEVDTASETLAKARIKVYGKASEGARRSLQNAFRFLRNRTKNILGYNA